MKELRKLHAVAFMLAVSAHAALAQSTSIGLGSSGGVTTLDPSVGIRNAGSKVQLYGTGACLLIGMVGCAASARNPRNLGIAAGCTVGAVAAIWMMPGVPAMLGVAASIFQ